MLIPKCTDAIWIQNKWLFYQNKLLETKYHLTIILTFLFFLPDCPKPEFIGDWFCDDITNIPECNFDGGDCCHVDSFTFSCNFCICYMDNLTTSTNTNASKFTLVARDFLKLQWNFLIQVTEFKYRISSYSFRPWIVSAPLCTVTFGLMYCDLWISKFKKE